MKELSGRTALVTGAASGIGLALCERFVQEGMAVVMADVEPSALDAAARMLSLKGGRILAHRTDVSDVASVASLAEAAATTFGPVHLLCCNAGVVRVGSAWDQSLDDWKWNFDVNVWGVVHCLRAFVPRMLAHGEDGHVVITSSAAGLMADASSSYVASKFAVAGIAEGMVPDLEGTAIGVSLLCPGGVKTRIFESERNRPPQLGERGKMSPAIAAQMARMTAKDRADQIEPSVIADLVVKAVRAGEFYVLPMQQGYKERVSARLDALRRAVDASSMPGV
jgi:NAD(P)-dependent dehydrogenase (short-subunit alcohol dehydrogenase family)